MGATIFLAGSRSADSLLVQDDKNILAKINKNFFIPFLPMFYYTLFLCLVYMYYNKLTNKING